MKFPKTLLSNIHSGYSGTPEIWKEFFNVFLAKYDLYEVKEGRTDNLLLNKYQQILQSLDVNKKIKEIEKLEKRLEISLSKSYKDFILAGGLEISEFLKYNFLTYRGLYNIDNIDFLFKDKKGYSSYKELVEINNESYKSDNIKVEELKKNYYSYFNYFDLFKYVNEDSNILDVIGSKFCNSELGYFSRGTLPEHKVFEKKIINLYAGLNRITLPFEKTQDGEYETWFFEDVNFYKFKSFAEMYMVDLIGNSYEILGGIRGIEELFKEVLSKMFINVPSW
ncbi:hypothetical protein ACWKWF_07485 [Acinetobacter kookii]